MFCRQCGNQMPDSIKFCPDCGAPAQAAGGQSRMKRADEVEFTIQGGDLQFLEILLDPGETVVAEAGAMMYMDSAIQMDTIFGDGSGRDAGGGLMGKLVSAGKRMVTGESLFMTTFTNRAGVKKCVSFAAPIPVR